MPELVAQIEQPPPVVAGQRPVVLAEVRDIVHQGVKPLLVRLRHIAAGRILDLAEIAGERDLLLVGDVLIVKDEDGIAVHPGLDRRDVLAWQRPPQIHPRDLADKDRMDLANGDSHRLKLPTRQTLLCPEKRQKRYADDANLSCLTPVRREIPGNYCRSAPR